MRLSRRTPQPSGNRPKPARRPHPSLQESVTPRSQRHSGQMIVHKKQYTATDRNAGRRPPTPISIVLTQLRQYFSALFINGLKVLRMQSQQLQD